MTTFRIDTHKKSGEVKLWMETPCGFIPIIAWANIDGVKEFADLLLNYYKDMNDKNAERIRVNDISEELLRQALGEDEYYE